MDLIVKLIIALLILFIGKELIGAFGLQDPAPKIIWIVLIVFVILWLVGGALYLPR